MFTEICVVGLGLMGGSLAGALRGFENARITGVDADPSVLARAEERGLIDEGFRDIEQAAARCDLLLFCVYAKQVPALLARCARRLRPGCLVSDICGVKSDLYGKILPLLPQGAGYVGLHPMAGKERDGIDNATPGLFQNTGMLICPTPASTPAAIEAMEALARHIGCARVEVVAYETHDEIIAYTSDLMHIAAAALCLDYHPGMNLTFTAGAFRDCTRIADINADAWSELLLENGPNVLATLEKYIASLEQFATALRNQDENSLRALLKKAGDNKRGMLTR